MTHSVATTILQQLGGNKFLAMTGAKNLLSSADSLQFRLPSVGRKGEPNALRITLKASDTYEIKAYRVRGLNCDLLNTHDDVYAENLRETFELITGLLTRL